jgi:hypothetical protein
MYLVNKNIVNLIDDIFWKMAFKTETDAEKVIIRIISFILDYTYYTNYFILYVLFTIFWIIQIILIIFTVSGLGSPGSWNCRSRVAGQTR